jgi:glucose-1-phosphate thymidylyltransferase
MIYLILKKLLGDGSAIGCQFTYAEQVIPNGLAQAFVIGEEFIGEDSVALLGDTFLWFHMDELLQSNKNLREEFFAYHALDPERHWSGGI